MKEGDGACPFCGAPVAASAAAAPKVASRLSRSALFALSAMGALAATDCGTAVALYGAPVPPPIDAGVDAEDGGVMALYGGPPRDAAPQEDVTSVALYGAAPPPSTGG